MDPHVGSRMPSDVRSARSATLVKSPVLSRHMSFWCLNILESSWIIVNLHYLVGGIPTPLKNMKVSCSHKAGGVLTRSTRSRRPRASKKRDSHQSHQEKRKAEWSADWIKKKLPARQDMVSTHKSNPKHAIGRERHGNLPALYVAWSMDFPITFAFLGNFARHGRSVREFLGDDVEGFPNHSGIASWSQIFGLKSHSSVPSGKP